ncbi:MAG: putative drug resistance protein [Glaciihabitans sp.]|nr:putative drug resistance protein [Glaciihabitans sp.]
MEIATETKKDHRWLGLFALLAAIVMNLLDSTIINVALPAIQADLGGSYSSLQWTAAAYTLALAVGLLTGGRLGDMFGRRTIWMIGVIGFVLASVACAVAWSPDALIAARVVQGLLGAAMIPQAFGLIRDLFPPQEIGKAFGALGPVIGLSTIAGPVVAGTLVDANIFGTGWRMVFLINLPLGLFALLAGRVALPLSKGTRGLKLDLTGVALAGAGMLLLVYPLVQGREQGWPAWMFLLLAAAVPVLAAFAIHQLRRKESGATPLVDLGILKRRSYTSGVAFVIVFFGAIVGFALSMALFLQLGLHNSPLRASLMMFAWALGAFFASGFAASTMAKLGRQLLIIGLVVMTIGLVGTYFTFTSSTAPSWWQLALPLFAFGFGMGMIFMPLFDIIVAEVKDDEVGSASGLLESLQQLGSSLGVAVLGTVFFNAIASAPTLDNFMHAGRLVTLITIGLAALAFVLAMFLPRQVRQSNYGPPAEEGATEGLVTGEPSVAPTLA